ncbi:aminotransferase class V-fold PLP-dependent enzyme, partial [Mesorhizobium sp. M4B.F.Ca.ET.049.02.1.2]
MAATRAYLDYNASAPLLEEARSAMIAALGAANPSSVHTEGRAARRLIEDARRDVAALVNAKAAHVVFTSGATEAAATLLTPDWQMGRGTVRMSRLYVSEADHPCVLNGGRFPAAQMTRIGVDRNGIADLDELAAVLAAHDESDGLPLVAIHAANNETGVIQPVERIAEIVRAAGGVLVIDAVQAAGRIPIDMSAGYADYLILSSHKIGGPKGVGAIVAAADLMMPKPLI